MTDYRGAIDAMDDMVESRERGYVCAVAVHALTLGLDDPEMANALRGAFSLERLKELESQGLDGINFILPPDRQYRVTEDFARRVMAKM